MTTRVAIVALVLFGLAGLQLGAAQTPPTLDERVAALETRVSVLEGTLLPPATLTPTTAPATATEALTATPVPPTATATPSSTPVPLTSTPTSSPTSTAVAVGWHLAGTHGGLNVHEHGDQPPAWVLASANLPFTQTRESHTGYKGALATSPGGVESYLIGHILSTEAARSHGDHDYQLWLRDPETGAVTYYAGLLDFGSPTRTDPIPERTSDTGERPIALSVGDGPCETWYSNPRDSSTVFDLGWTICGRYQSFDGTVRGGVGTFRTIDWIVLCDFLPADSPLRDNCRIEFGVPRLSFLVNSRDYSAPGIAPIN